MTAKFSAYLSVFNDWDILPAALQSVAPYINELVVADGAYEWMTPYLESLGISPLRSDDRVYQAIEASRIPFRVISRTWRNEPEKRMAGYAACTNDIIIRIDADEVLFFDDAALERALASGLAVGEMLMPNYVAPGWISHAKHLPTIERQCLLFDRRQVSSELHLNYLWLILTADQLPEAGAKPFTVYPEPLAFNAHLTNWRTPTTGGNRAAFYIMNWMRQNGVPWLPSLRSKPLANVGALFDVIPAEGFLSSLRRGRIASGMTESPDDRVITRSPLTANQEAKFDYLYHDLMTELTEMNQIATRYEQTFLTCYPILFDLTASAARDAIIHDGTIRVRISSTVVSAKAKFLKYSAELGSLTQELEVQIVSTDLLIHLPPDCQITDNVLRQCVEFEVWLESSDLAHTFRVIT